MQLCPRIKASKGVRGTLSWCHCMHAVRLIVFVNYVCGVAGYD
jgi:hypothetical protein